MSQMLALAAEALLESRLGDETRVVDVKVMEGKEQIVFRDCLSAVDGHSEELCIVNFSVMIKVNTLKDLVYFLFRHVQLVESTPNLAQLQGP